MCSGSDDSIESMKLSAPGLNQMDEVDEAWVFNENAIICTRYLTYYITYPEHIKYLRDARLL